MHCTGSIDTRYQDPYRYIAARQLGFFDPKRDNESKFCTCLGCMRSSSLLSVLDWLCCVTEPRHAGNQFEPQEGAAGGFTHLDDKSSTPTRLKFLDSVIHLLGLSSAACRDASKNAANCYEQCAHRKVEMKSHIYSRAQNLLRRDNRPDSDTKSDEKEFVYYNDGVTAISKSVSIGTNSLKNIQRCNQSALRHFSDEDTWPVFYQQCALANDSVACQDSCWGIFTNLEMCANMLYSVGKITGLPSTIANEAENLNSEFLELLKREEVEAELSHGAPAEEGDLRAILKADILKAAQKVHDLFTRTELQNEACLLFEALKNTIPNLTFGHLKECFTSGVQTNIARETVIAKLKGDFRVIDKRIVDLKAVLNDCEEDVLKKSKKSPKIFKLRAKIKEMKSKMEEGQNDSGFKDDNEPISSEGVSVGMRQMKFERVTSEVWPQVLSFDQPSLEQQLEDLEQRELKNSPEVTKLKDKIAKEREALRDNRKKQNDYKEVAEFQDKLLMWVEKKDANSKMDETSFFDFLLEEEKRLREREHARAAERQVFLLALHLTDCKWCRALHKSQQQQTSENNDEDDLEEVADQKASGISAIIKNFRDEYLRKRPATVLSPRHREDRNTKLGSLLEAMKWLDRLRIDFFELDPEGKKPLHVKPNPMVTAVVIKVKKSLLQSGTSNIEIRSAERGMHRASSAAGTHESSPVSESRHKTPVFRTVFAIQFNSILVFTELPIIASQVFKRPVNSLKHLVNSNDSRGREHLYLRIDLTDYHTRPQVDFRLAFFLLCLLVLPVCLALPCSCCLLCLHWCFSFFVQIVCSASLLDLLD